ncbi:hypothetical protein BU251_03660 [Candidatus Velamenicoccus archaeovorus]|uniref:Uncharacterized protein n=1 Tax=Velamenicoccus archaeovorus TaxID=1930593 RepID=A0A410P485_VELA1|nr:hypothetical protein [Candidatus Velamenicoccus archaeovorus]QAT16891.1 hypothetical protein BU251_03660 [Candidatus Velamenicoccus archaeovorus]
MDNIFFELKNQVYETAVLVVAFCKSVNLYIAGGVLLVFYLAVLRKWMPKKILSFCLTISLLFIFYLRIDNLLLTTFSQEASSFSIGVFRTVSIITAGVIFLYYATIRQ